MTCPVCGRPAPSLKAGIVRGEILSQRCDPCFNRETQKKKPAEFAGKFRRAFDASNHRRETTQSWEPDFVNAYPDKAREFYSEEEMRRLGH